MLRNSAEFNALMDTQPEGGLWCADCLSWVLEEDCTYLDVGIGPYEYWGATGTDVSIIFTHKGCEHQIFTDPSLTTEYWPEEEPRECDEYYYDPDDDLPPT